MSDTDNEQSTETIIPSHHAEVMQGVSLNNVIWRTKNASKY